MARIKMVKTSGGRAQGKSEGASYDEYVAAVAAELMVYKDDGELDKDSPAP